MDVKDWNYFSANGSLLFQSSNTFLCWRAFHLTFIFHITPNAMVFTLLRGSRQNTPASFYPKAFLITSKLKKLCTGFLINRPYVCIEIVLVFEFSLFTIHYFTSIHSVKTIHKNYNCNDNCMITVFITSLYNINCLCNMKINKWI